MTYLLTQKHPCGNCPYRKDAPLALWAKDHFEDLLENEKDIVGKVYGCHKQNGSVCVGWAILQVNNDLPCNALRMEVLFGERGKKGGLTFEYLESLKSPTPLFETVLEMSIANFPELTKIKKDNESNL